MRYAIYVWRGYSSPPQWSLTANIHPIIEEINEAYRGLEEVIKQNGGCAPLPDQYIVVEENTDMIHHPPPATSRS